MTTDLDTCVRCHSELERDDLRCPVCRLVTPFSEPRDRAEIAVEVLRCDGCGAAVSYNIRAAAPECAFCGSVMHVEIREDPLEQVEHYLPFAVDRGLATDVFREWLGNLGWFRPADLRSESRLESMGALWWVGWVVDAEALVSWAADSNSGTGRADWAPHAGRTDMVFDDVVSSASRGLTADETNMLLNSYDLATALDSKPMTEPEATIEQFDVRRSHARQHVTEMIERMVKDKLEREIIPGERFRNIRASVLTRKLNTRRFGFPAWVMAYRYGGKLYRFVLSGQDSTCLMGDAPISAAKVIFAILGGALGLLLLLSIIGGLM